MHLTKKYNKKIGSYIKFRGPWTVKNVFFDIPGDPETLKTGKAIVTIAAFLTDSTKKIALF
jgi:hypothetical protein